jgi:hypothetical protein
MENKRRILYDKLFNLNVIKNPNYVNFKDTYFTNVDKLGILYRNISDKKLYEGNFKKFINVFGCDLPALSNSSFCVAKPISTAPVKTKPTPVNFTSKDVLSGKVNLKWGDKGKVVGELQQLLVDVGMGMVSKSGKIDNLFGRNTKKAVYNLQQGALGDTKPNGIVDSTTWIGIQNLLKNKNTVQPETK